MKFVLMITFWELSIIFTQPHFQLGSLSRSGDSSTNASIFASLDFSKSHYASEIWDSLKYLIQKSNNDMNFHFLGAD